MPQQSVSLSYEFEKLYVRVILMDFKKPFKTILRHMAETRLDKFALGKSLNIYREAAEQANSFFCPPRTPLFAQ